MATFLKRLDGLLEAAREKGVVDANTSEALRAYAGEREKGHGVLSLAAVLGWLGSGVAGLGVILLISANWEEISDFAKLAGVVLLLAATHGTGLWIRLTDRPAQKTAEALNFLGAWVFLGGIALVAQIYNLNDHPPNGILLWLIGIGPLAFLLRSPSITLLVVFGILWWAHWEGGSRDAFRYGYSGHLALEIAMGALCVGLSPFARQAAPAPARVLRFCGTFLLFGGLYVLTFYRHFSLSRNYRASMDDAFILPLIALGLGALMLGIGGRHLVPESKWFRNRLLLFLGLVLSVTGYAVGTDAGYLPRGEDLNFFDFGSTRSFDYAELGCSLAAWCLWFALALWCLGFGSLSGRKTYLNTSVLAVGLGSMTIFFDLIGSLMATGTIFFVGGLVLLGSGWALERWRRGILKRMAGSIPQ